MGRRSSGLRNRYRQGASSSYSSKGKAYSADRYGEYDRGVCKRQDSIAGRHMSAINQEGFKGV